MAWVAPAISAGGALLSAQGSKKQSKQANKSPQVPAIFGPSLGSALGLINSRLSGGAPAWRGGFTAQMNPMQQIALQQGRDLLGNGQAGFQSAQRVTQGIAETGLDADTINLMNKQLDPLYNYIQGRGVADVREAQALGGRFYGSGGVGAESDYLANLGAQRAGQVLSLAPQFQTLRLQGANQLGNLIGQQQAFNVGSYGFGEQERGLRQQDLMAQYQEFLRQDPINAVQYLSALMGTTPLQSQYPSQNWATALGPWISDNSAALAALFSPRQSSATGTKSTGDPLNPYLLGVG